ncbi:MAG: hypothetical protein E7265_10160 [Lachnospiraceae bacterium]|nr:hypothetical protein [Lachnospiraceae bacterium]
MTKKFKEEDMKKIKRCRRIIAAVACVLVLCGMFFCINGHSNAEGDEMGGYLWTFFEAEGGYEKIFFGFSKDGIEWQKLNKDESGNPQPILVNDAPGSDLGVRDPHIIRSHDGEKYWILGTDLHAEGGGQGGSGWDQYNASKNIVVWESTDLVNWSSPKLVYSGMDTAGCVWAPEAIYDETNEDYVVYWSTRDNSLKNTNQDALRVYVCRTTDFNTFTTPKVWLSEDNANEGINIIDSTIVHDGEYYYRLSTSDWFTVIDRSKTLDTNDVLDVSKDAGKSLPNGSWERIVTRNGSSAAGFDKREGFTVYKLPSGKWCAMGDNSGYAAFVTDNLGNGNFTMTAASFPDGRFRHGTVMRLTKKEEAAVLAAYGNEQLLNGAVIGSCPDRNTALGYRGTDDHTAIYSKIDYDKKYIMSYVKNGTDSKNVPVYFDMISENVSIEVNGKAFVNGDNLDLTKQTKVKFTFNNLVEEYDVKPLIQCNNSVLPGQYADPDIDYFDGKFWIFPTTDGYPGWSGTKFHAWSSEDLVNWNDEGVIMELANNNPGKNENGVQIASSPWAVNGSAWAPAIEKKNDKYYFYYCGKDSSGTSAIGVAQADSPAGPYEDLGEPLITVAMCRENQVAMGQAIDPSIFTEDDGTSYVTFGNGNAAIVKLNEDMMSIDEQSLRQIDGLDEFRESVVVIKRDGKYHWTWTCDDANSPNYRVNYGVSDTLDGDITIVHKPLLQRNDKFGIRGTGHQSMVHVKDGYGMDRYFIAYHRFYTPLNIFGESDGLGVHRESCIDEVTFDENGYMNVVYPTLEGVSVYMGTTGNEDANQTPVPSPVPTASPTETPKNDKPVVYATVPPAVTPYPSPTTKADTETGKTNKAKTPVLELKSKSSVKRGKKLIVKLSITNPDGSKVTWSLDKKGKKLFKLTNKKKKSVTLVARKKKGKGVLTAKYGKLKVKKTIRVK